MTPTLAEKWADCLHAMRVEAGRHAMPDLEAPQSVADAYLVQSELAKRNHGGARGWKVSALTAEAQQKFGVDRAVGGPLWAPYVFSSGHDLVRTAFRKPLIECEIAFQLGRDLPPRAEPYTRAELDAAVAAALPLIEIVDPRLPMDAPILAHLADCMDNGAIVIGKTLADWRDIRLDAIDIVLSCNDEECVRGSAATILGDPLLAVVALANAQPLSSGGLRAGQIVTTGTCTVPELAERGAYVADFGAFGEVRFRFT